MKAILNADRCQVKRGSEVLATHPSQYGETKVLEMKIDLVPGVILYKSCVTQLNPDQRENL